MKKEASPEEAIPANSPFTGETTRPVFYRFSENGAEREMLTLLEKKPYIRVHDTIKGQLEELMTALHPSARFDAAGMKSAVQAHLGGCALRAYGVWVYYPWNERLVHILDEEEFVLLRTNRNKYKITDEEKEVLSKKKIGVIGLSVGQSVALTLAMERGFGALRIADFDSLELSNLNRLRAGVHQLGLPKTALVAREIAEIDPFLNITCINEGIKEENMERFLLGDGKLDLLIDECDSLDIKILSRQNARKNRIPVLMDTSDRGMIDIERFDREPGREILHGLLGDTSSFVEKLADPGKRMELSLQIAGGEGLSERMKRSVPEIGKKIRTWPQLASAVFMGGAVIGDVARKILIGEDIPSGRFYVDLDRIIHH